MVPQRDFTAIKITEPEAELPITIRRPRAAWLGGLLVAAITAMLGVFLLGFAVVLIIGGRDIGVAAILVVVAGALGILFAYVLGDARAKLGWRVVIGSDAIDLDLPRRRSLVHRLDAVHARVRFDEIDAVETRLEAYRSFGMANMNRSYALRLKSGDLIFLGEDRALGTELASEFVASAVDAITRHGRIPGRDFGMAEGRGGVLAVLFTRPPPWDAPTLDADRQLALWRRAQWTGMLAVLGAIMVLAAVFIQQFF